MTIGAWLKCGHCGEPLVKLVPSNLPLVIYTVILWIEIRVGESWSAGGDQGASDKRCYKTTNQQTAGHPSLHLRKGQEVRHNSEPRHG